MPIAPPGQDTGPLREYRCSCNRLLCKGATLRSIIEIKCTRCGTLVVLGSAAPERTLACVFSGQTDLEARLIARSAAAPLLESALGMNLFSVLGACEVSKETERFRHMVEASTAYDHVFSAGNRHWRLHLIPSGDIVHFSVVSV